MKDFRFAPSIKKLCWFYLTSLFSQDKNICLCQPACCAKWWSCIEESLGMKCVDFLSQQQNSVCHLFGKVIYLTASQTFITTFDCFHWFSSSCSETRITHKIARAEFFFKIIYLIKYVETSASLSYL